MTSESVVTDKARRPHDRERLSGHMGVGGVAMSVLAFSSPLTTVAGFLPVLLMFAGDTAPVLYLLQTAVMLTFAVGLVAMSRTVKNPGGFYAFISAGLGRAAGMGGAALSLLGYLLIGFFGAPFFGQTMQLFVRDALGGPDIAWWVYGLGAVAITTILAYNKIDISAKVLVTVMALEIVAVINFNLFAIGDGVANGQDASVALPSLGNASIGLALLFSASNFLGFEATVIYRDEVKNPDKTIPRATYLAVAGIGLFYAFAAWAFVTFLGAGNAQAAAEANVVTLFNDTATAVVGKTFTDIITVLLFTSVLAAILSIQNASARYTFVLARDGALPRFLSRVHPRQKSPYLSALAVGVLWVVLTIIFAIVGLAPEFIYPQAVGAGTFALILLMTIASIAVMVYFIRRRKTHPGSLWKTRIAPAIAAVCLGIITVLAIVNFPDLIAGSVELAVVFVVATFLVGAAGVIYALVLKARKPEVYATLDAEPDDA